MTDKENSVETDIALIKKDIRQIERVFKKVDSAVDQLSDILKTVAVQQTILDNSERRVDTLEKKIVLHEETENRIYEELRKEIEDLKNHSNNSREKRHRELMDCINKMNEDVNKKLDKQENRIRTLENWRWYILGAGAVVILVFTKFPWATFFG